MIRRCLLASAFVCGLVLARPAGAQPKPSPPTASFTYDFAPDDLIGDTLATTPPLLRVRPHPLRVMLLRPRASFVPEMLKSVELM